MKNFDIQENEIHPNFYGGVNKRRLQEAMEQDQSAFRFREERRAQTLREQQHQLDSSDYSSLRLTLSQEGLDDITAINKHWEKRLAEIKAESEKKYVRFVVTSLIVLALLSLVFALLGSSLFLLCIVLMLFIVPRKKTMVDTKDLLLWNLFKDK